MKNPIVMFNDLLKTKSWRKAWKIADYIVSVTLAIYLFPIIFGLIFSLNNPVGLIFWGVVVFSAFPFTRYILIPKIDKKFDIYSNHKVKALKEMESDN